MTADFESNATNRAVGRRNAGRWMWWAARRPVPNRSRRAAELVEYALVLPVLLVLVLGMADYGWYYFQQSLCSQAVATAMRAGALRQPTDDEAGLGQCQACVTVARTEALAGLADLGITANPSDLTPRLVDIGGACTLVLDARIPHRPLVGLVPLPGDYRFHASAVAPAVSGCTP